VSPTSGASRPSAGSAAASGGGSERLDVAQLVDLLGLEPLAGEGGWFRQTWRAAPVAGSNRPAASTIFYLLGGHDDSFSALHRLDADEVWHHHLGDPVRLSTLGAAGRARHVTLGADLRAGHRLQAVVGAQTWMGARLEPNGRWAVLGMTMAPGWTDEAFELGRRAELVARWPAEAELIASLTRC